MSNNDIVLDFVQEYVLDFSQESPWDIDPNSILEMHFILDSDIPCKSSSILHGATIWIVNGNLHNDDGPAVEYKNGAKYYYEHGKRHCSFGPAVTYENGNREYWIKGKQCSLLDIRWYSFLFPEEL